VPATRAYGGGGVRGDQTEIAPVVMLVMVVEMFVLLALNMRVFVSLADVQPDAYEHEARPEHNRPALAGQTPGHHQTAQWKNKPLFALCRDDGAPARKERD
jgi:hypothetical protein